MEEKWHTSRHFLGLQARAARWIPSAPPSVQDAQGRAPADRLFALGGWHQDTERDYVWVANLHTVLLGDGGAQVESAETFVQAAWQHQGQVTDLQVRDLGGGEVIIIVASSTGSLSHLKLYTPRDPGADISAVQVLSGSNDDHTALAPWLPGLHKGAIASVDLCSNTQEILSAGLDGRLVVLPLTAASQGTPVDPFYDSGGASSFNAACWCNGALRTFVTASTAGGLACWDTRSGPKPVRRSPTEWGSSQWLAVTVHEARPHLCAAGGVRGEAAIWDLRFASKPLIHRPPEVDASDIWEVKWDASEPFAREIVPPMLLCSEIGDLQKVTLGPDGQLESELLYSEGSSINSFDIEPTTGRDILWVSEQECAGYLRRPMP